MGSISINNLIDAVVHPAIEVKTMVQKLGKNIAEEVKSTIHEVKTEVDDELIRKKNRKLDSNVYLTKGKVVKLVKSIANNVRVSECLPVKLNEDLDMIIERHLCDSLVHVIPNGNFRLINRVEDTSINPILPSTFSRYLKNKINEKFEGNVVITQLVIRELHIMIEYDLIQLIKYLIILKGSRCTIYLKDLELCNKNVKIGWNIPPTISV